LVYCPTFDIYVADHPGATHLKRKWEPSVRVGVGALERLGSIELQNMNIISSLLDSSQSGYIVVMN
jgi:hypothetical protein